MKSSASEPGLSVICLCAEGSLTVDVSSQRGELLILLASSSAHSKDKIDKK